MALYFKNLHPYPIWTSLVYKSNSCAPTPFKKIGWYQVNGGETFNAWNTDLRRVNRYVSFCAQMAGGELWIGDDPYFVTDQQFHQCFDDWTNCNKWHYYREVDLLGWADVVITFGPDTDQVSIEGSVPQLGQLDFDWYPIVFGSGIPVGGYSHLTIWENGNYTFSGHFHDSTGLVDYDTALVWGVKDSQNIVYTFQHSGHASLDNGDDDWNIKGWNKDIAKNWRDIADANYAVGSANVDGELSQSLGKVLGFIGSVVTIAVVAA